MVLEQRCQDGRGYFHPVRMVSRIVLRCECSGESRGRLSFHKDTSFLFYMVFSPNSLLSV